MIKYAKIIFFPKKSALVLRPTQYKSLTVPAIGVKKMLPNSTHC
jgi:hypothetical protein